MNYNEPVTHNIYIYISNLLTHPFHLVDQSPWPLLASVFGLGTAVGLVEMFFFFNSGLLLFRILGIIILVSQWWRDVSREGSYIGKHSYIVELGLRRGIILFIISEVFFFLSFFWRYFHRSLRPNAELGGVWPPFGISVFNPFGVPLLNRIILLSSGASVTWAHHAIILGSHSQANKSLVLTIVLGIYFRLLQGYEYYEARFRIRDSAYGSTFFIATGFHGLHVIVGTLFLLASNIRLLRGKLRHGHHFGFEASAWYWHFVDVVWLFLYVRIYAWRSAN